MPSIGNRIKDIAKKSPETADKEVFKRKIPGGQKLFCIRIVNADDPETFTFSTSFTIPVPRK